MRKLMPPFICSLAITAVALLLLAKSSPIKHPETSRSESGTEVCIHGENCVHGNKPHGDAGSHKAAKRYSAITLNHDLVKENKSISEAKAGDRFKLDFGDELLLDVRVRFTKTSADSRKSVSMELTGRRGWVHWLKKADGSIMGNILLKEGGKNIVYKYSGEEGELVIQRITQQEFICSSGDTDASVGMPTENAPFEPAQQAAAIPLLNSLPGAVAVVYIDFDGEQVSGTRWNTLEGRPETINAEPAGFDEARIREVWEEVAEDMRPFKINVTTDRAVYDAAPIGKRMMSIVTPTTDAFPGSGGVAFLESFYDGNDDPCWTFNLTPSSCAQTVSHEVGHTFGLFHDGLLGQPQQTEYHRGNGTWGPIMGAPFGLNVVSWSDGVYEGATNTQDDLQIINDRSAEFRDDQYGDTDAEGFDFAEGTFDETVDIEGIIETPADVDVFTFTTSGGTITLNANPEGVDISGQGFVTNMNIRLQIYNELGELVTEADPADSYGASITTELESGNYTFHVEGTNSGSPDVSGFSDYGSIGQYAVTGNIPGLGGDGDLTPPSADLLDPANGEIADLRLLNLQGYLEVTFTDIGQGIDPDSIDGDELALSGGGLGDVVLDGSVTPVIAGSTYRYGFTGSFVEGSVDVEFVAGSFADISDLANVNETETESFTVERQPFTEFIDDADDGFSASAGWNVYTGNSAISGYNTDFTYAQSGDGSETVTWTFEGLDPGSYEVAITWHARDVYRASNAPYSVFDGATLVSSTTVDQGVEPAADYIKAGKAFEIVFASVDITSNTLVVELSNNADDYVIADAVRIKQLEPSAPTADLVSPGNGDSIGLTLLNARTYLDVTFSDIGQGINPSSINGDELLLGGSGLNTVALVTGPPTLISGTTYRYELTGEFVAGEVDVTFVAGSFFDLASTPNLNLEETESFTVTLAPPPSSLIIDDADPGFTATDGWSVYPGNDSINGYNNDFTYTQPGSTTELATWTFDGLLPGDYEVAISWSARDIYRASNAPFTVYDGTNPVSPTPVTVNQQVEPTADYIEGDKPFQIVFASVSVSSGTLVVELSNAADDYVIADAVRIELLEPAGPDVTAPTADLSNPANGSTIDPVILNAQGFIEVSFADNGDGVDNASITGDELLLSGTGAAGVTLSGTAIRQGTSDTYRYGFTGEFVVGEVDVTFVAGSFADLAGTPNANEAETESFTVADAPPPPASQIVDDADPGFTASAGWGVYLGNTAIDGYNNDFTYSAPASETSPGTASWTFSGLIPGSYEVAITWHARDVYRASNAPYTVYDGIPNGVTNLIVSTSVDQGAEPTADYVEGGKNFEVVFASVGISSSTLVVELSNEADDYVIADAVRIKLLEPAGPEPTLPTANLTSPANGFTVDPSVLNAQAYLEVSFSDPDDGLDLTTIDGDELSLSGSGVGTAELATDAPILVAGTTYRYAFTGEFVDGGVDVTFVAGSFADQIIPNFNVAETESFTVATTPPTITSAPVADLVNPAEGDIIDPAVLNAQGYLEVVFSDIDDGLDLSTIDGDELALSGTGVGTATLDGTAILVSGTTYRYGFTGNFVEGAVMVEVLAGSFADLAIPNLNLADDESFTLSAPLAEAEVLYRVNCGGSQLASIDDEPLDWSADTSANPSIYVNGDQTNSTYATGNAVTASASVPDSVPLALFQSERWDSGPSPEMQWNFPVANGDYEVRLYFAEIVPSKTAGVRVFDVAIEGASALTDYDVFVDAGGFYVGVMKNFQVTVSDELLTIDMLHGVENPAIKGIEIIKLNTINKAPVISPVADQNNTVTDLVSLQVIASDDDGDTLSYSAQDLPAGLSIDAVSGLISGSIASGANLNSPYAVTVTVRDNGNPQQSVMTSLIWVVNVEGPNNNTLTITPVTNQSNAVEDSVNLQVNASDTNGNTLSYSANGLPAGLSINSSSGLISGVIATGADLNSPYAVTVTVTDDGSPQASANTSFAWTVSGDPSNKTPTISTIAGQTSTVDDTVSLQVVASDADAGDTLGYSASGLPAGLSINSSSGLISGTIATGADLNSPYSVTVTVTDDGEPQASAETSFAWTVNAIPPDINVLYRVNCGGSQLASIDDEPLDWSADTSADPSIYVNGDQTNSTYATGNAVTASASVPDSVPLAIFQSERWDSSPSPEMQWNFPVANGGYEVRLYFAEIVPSKTAGVRVFDVAIEGASVLTDYDVFVDAGGTYIGVMKNFQVTVSDELLTIDMLHGIENPAIKGIEIIDLNGTGGPGNNTPTISTIAGQTSTVDDTVSLQVVASDADAGDTLGYSASGLPDGLSIDAISGLISGTIATGADLNSPYSVTVTVTDDGEPQASAETSFAWTVNAIPPDINVLYRVNCGGSQLASIDDEPLDWSADTSANPSIYVNGDQTNSTYATGNAVTASASVPDSVPLALFQSERWDSSPSPEMQWNFPVANGGYEVRLYFAEIVPSKTAGVRVFDVAIEGASVLTDYDVFVDAGGTYIGVMKNFQVTVSDELLTIDMLHGIENPAIKGIEIIDLNGTGGPGNNTPTISTIAGQTGTVTDAVSLQVVASDADAGDTLGYSASGLPDGLSIDAISGLISGTIATGADLNSPYSVTVTVTDDGEPQASAETSFAWTVNAIPPDINVLYRVNCGGSQLASIDDEPLDWSADTSANPSIYVNGDQTNSTYATGNAVTASASVPDSVPLALFQSERWDSSPSPEMQWDFPVANGDYEVRLYFAEIVPSKTAGVRVFDVAIEGASALTDYDVFVDAGGFYVGVMKNFQVTVSDELLTIEMLHGIENPAIKGIEILQRAAEIPASASTSITSDQDSITSNLSTSTHSRSLLTQTHITDHALDTDGDGVADTLDIFPSDPDFKAISDYINLIINYVVDDRVIFDSDWKEPENEAEFVAQLEALLAIVIAAEQAQDNEWAALLYLEALKKLGDELIVRTDGLHNTGSLANDWVTTQEAQDLIHADLILLSEYLWLIVR